METTLVTAPSYFPITLAEAKDYLRISHTNQDTVIKNLIRTATAKVEARTNRQLVLQTWDAFYDRFPSANERFSLPRTDLENYYLSYGAKSYIELPFGQLVSVTSVKYLDENESETTFAATNYTVDTDSIIGKVVLKNNKSWPTTSLFDNNGVIIRFTSGWYAGDTWVADTPYAENAYIVPTTSSSQYEAGIVYKCTTSGTSGPSEPTWGLTIAGTTADNTAVWTAIGEGVPYELKAVIKILVNDLYDTRESEILTIGGSFIKAEEKLSSLINQYEIGFF